jgi:hypothetical protein
VRDLEWIFIAFENDDKNMKKKKKNLLGFGGKNFVHIFLILFELLLKI